MGKNQLWPTVFGILLLNATALEAHAQANSATRNLKNASPTPSASLTPGPYYALVIGNNDYRPPLLKLQTAVNDANEVAKLLHDTYNFQSKVLLNATRNDILSALYEYRRTLPPESNLLIYYAGHGNHDRDTEEAYWLPVDAAIDGNANWISADDITTNIRAIPSRHVVIISDSCYSGAIQNVTMRGRPIAIDPQETNAFLAKKLQEKSRTLLSSGGDEPVADGGGDGHSIFAQALLDGLRIMEFDKFTADELYTMYVNRKVAGQSGQDPHYFPLARSGDEGGDFVFIRTTKAPEETEEQKQQQLRFKELSQRQAELAIHGFDEEMKKYNLGASTMESVIRAHEKLVEAELAMCPFQDVKDCRIVVYQQALKEAAELTEKVTMQFKIGVAPEGAVNQADLHRTELQGYLMRESATKK